MDDDYCDADELDFVAQRTAEETIRRMQPYINRLKERINQLEKQLEAHQQIQSAADVRERYYSTNLHQGQVQYLRDGTLEQSEDCPTET
jgi:prefoldin subunit 5